MYTNIPVELRSLPQWVCANKDKIPLSPRTRTMASVADPATWATFEEAVVAGFPHIGFVLTTLDPYTIIDLDDKPHSPCTPEQRARHQKILASIESYTERSVSGNGYHIIVKGTIPAGVHRDNVEIYSSSRYMICTGDTVRPSPIKDYQTILDTLFREMAPAKTIALEEREMVLEDNDLVEMATYAANGDKFLSLCRGEWEAMGYGSQSEADFALLSIFAFYTDSNEQVRRLFRWSKLGEREKAQRNDTYLDFALRKIRANAPPEITFELPQDIPLPPATQLVEAIPPVAIPEALTFPPGLVGEVAQYIYSAAVRPVPEIALAASIAFVAGICGRSYNISGTGLNTYIIILANTGVGKEGGPDGIDSLISAVRQSIPMATQFVGPAAFASGQALIKCLDEKPCFFSILGEFGLTLKELCDPRASGPQIMLKKVLLDLYNKSGRNKILRSSVYSDTEKNTKEVQAPSLTIYGEATPETFFGALDTSHIAEGLVPRFMVMEYSGPRPPRNKAAFIPPSDQLVSKVADLLTISLTTSNNNTCEVVKIDKEALPILDALDLKADDHINSAGSEVESQLWNRAHLKSLRLAALVAVGCDMQTPTITKDIARWAVAFVEKDVALMVSRFSKGETGTGDHRLESHVRKAVTDYLGMGPEKRASYKIPTAMLNQAVIPFHYLRRRVRLINSFKTHRLGPVRALEDTIKDMVKAEILRVVPPKQAAEKYGVTTEIYVLGPTW